MAALTPSGDYPAPRTAILVLIDASVTQTFVESKFQHLLRAVRRENEERVWRAERRELLARAVDQLVIDSTANIELPVLMPSKLLTAAGRPRDAAGGGGKRGQRARDRTRRGCW